MEQMEQMEQILPKNSQNTRLKGLFRNYRSICSNRSTTTRAPNQPSTERGQNLPPFQGIMQPRGNWAT